MSDAVSYAFEQLAPSEPLAPDGLTKALAQATAESDAIRERAHAEGFAEGHGAAYRDATEQIGSALQALEQACAALHTRGEEIALLVEREAVELALALAEKVLGGALQARPEAVVEVVRGALWRVSAQRQITVLVNPADLETLRDALGELQEQGNDLELRDIQADPRISVGGALVRTSEGELDVRVQTQLERAREAIAAELGASPP